MKNRKLLFICTVILLCTCLLSGCRAVSRVRHSASEALIKLAEVIDTEPESDYRPEVRISVDSTDLKLPDPEDNIIEFTMFTAMPGTEINPENDIQEIIAEKTGKNLVYDWFHVMGTELCNYEMSSTRYFEYSMIRYFEKRKESVYG